jgi:hypothetical protein
MKKTFKHDNQKTHIKQYLKDYPDTTIPDLIRVFGGNSNSIRYALIKFGIKIKLRPHARKQDFTAYVSSNPDLPPHQLGKTFNASERTIYRHLTKNKIKEFRIYNKCDIKKINHHIRDYPDVTISDLAKMFKKSYVGMYAMLKRHNITIKNKLCYKDRKKPSPRKKK